MLLGIDIGGTNVKFGVVDKNYNIIKKYSIETKGQRSADEVLADIKKTSAAICREFSVERVGIGCPGNIDTARGICISSANLPFDNTPITALMEAELNLPVSLANDARCAVCGELVSGVGKEYETFFMITLGTGVGGGIVINGRPYFGRRGGAGEIGHTVIDKDGIICRCGQRGCFEQYASVSALIRDTEDAAKAAPKSLLAELCTEGVSGQTVFDAMARGCPTAEAVIDGYTDYVAIGITNAIRMLQPEAVVIGGAIANEGERLIAPLRKKISPKLCCEVVAAKQKNNAGIIGAVAISELM